MVRLPDVIATTSDRLGSHLSTNRLLLLLLLLHLLHLLHLLLLLLQVGQWVGGRGTARSVGAQRRFGPEMVAIR